jgi:hypothetical protein
MEIREILSLAFSLSPRDRELGEGSSASPGGRGLG